MMRLDPTFPCCSPTSANPDTIPARAQAHELSRELDRRRVNYARHVDQHTMTQGDADRLIDVMRVLHDYTLWQADAAAWMERAHPSERMQPEMLARRTRSLDAIREWRWSDLVAELRREILNRRKKYPRWIAGGTLAPLDAQHQLERLEAVHFRLWRQAELFMPDNLFSHRDQIFGEQGDQVRRLEFRALCRAHLARFDPEGRRGELIDDVAHAGEQKEMAFA
jgi:hypothetical protein